MTVTIATVLPAWRHPIGVAALIVVIAWPAMVRAGGEAADCPPAAVVSGDPELAERVTDELDARGIADRAPAGCPRVTATIREQGGVLVLSLVDGYGQVGERRVRDVSTAAALIESWTRQESVDVALAIEDEPVAAPAAAVTSSAVVVEAAPRVAPRFGVSLAFETTRSDDGSTWVGGALAGCARIGRVCVGGELRGIADTRATGATGHARRGVDLYASVDLPFRAGPVTVSPGLGAGLAWARTGDTGPHMDIAVSDTGAAATAHVVIARPIARAFAIELGVAGDAVVFGDGGVPDLLPAGEVRIGLGLRYGGR